eukprot:938987-Pleurochrysis_carterae.AAC.1
MCAWLRACMCERVVVRDSARIYARVHERANVRSMHIYAPSCKCTATRALEHVRAACRVPGVCARRAQARACASARAATRRRLRSRFSLFACCLRPPRGKIFRRLRGRPLVGQRAYERTMEHGVYTTSVLQLGHTVLQLGQSQYSVRYC